MKYTKENIAAVQKRLQEYEDVLASDEFECLDQCFVCDTVDGRFGRNGDCNKCLWGPEEYAEHAPCKGRNVGAMCWDKNEQRDQYKHLLRQLDKNGYQFKVVK